MTVTLTGTDDLGGSVNISHPSDGNGLYTAYYHMRKVYARRGQYVAAQRTTIGLVGRSGCASGYHTHVERWHGSPWRSGSYRVNPWTLIDYGYYFPSRYR